MLKIILLLIFFTLLTTGGYYLYSQKSAPNPTLPTHTITPNKSTKIGILYLKTLKSHQIMIDNMKKTLAEKGYSPEYVETDVKASADFPKAAQDLVSSNVSLIVAGSTPAVKAALKATSTIPILYSGVGDPVANGVAQSLDSSGNNSTGITTLSVELTVRRLNLLKELKPTLKTAYFIYEPGEVASENSRKKSKEESSKLGVTLIEKTASSAADFKKVAASFKPGEAEFITLASSAFIWSGSDIWIQAQNDTKIPFLGTERGMAEKGAVISYGPDYNILGQQLATIVEQVIKGAKPQYLPIQRPSKIELIINDKAAKDIGFVPAPVTINRAERINP